jgi:hypothetical protein
VISVIFYDLNYKIKTAGDSYLQSVCTIFLVESKKRRSRGAGVEFFEEWGVEA